MNTKPGGRIERVTALAEFEGDDNAVQYLKQATTAGQFEHRASELRMYKKAEAAYAVHAKPYAEKGFTILPHDHAARDCGDNLIHLTDLSPCPFKDGMFTEIEANPQAWAVHISKQNCYVDIRTGHVISEELIDWDADDADEPAEGLIHPKHLEQEKRYLPDYYCVDTAAASICRWAEYCETQGWPSEGEKQRSTHAASLRYVRQMAARIDLLGEAAQIVRRAWVRDRLLSRRTAPEGTANFIAQQLATDPLLTDRRTIAVGAELLGIQSGRADIKAMAAELTDNADPRAAITVLGLVLGAIEAQTRKYSGRDERSQNVIRYLRFLVVNGYEPAPVEQIILGELQTWLGDDGELLAQANQGGEIYAIVRAAAG
jgi:ParB family transcriptional regulator, chromosome partitioning protein